MYILFDIGGTKARIAASKDGKTVEESKSLSTPQNFQEGIGTLKNVIEELTQGQTIQAIAGGIPGPLNKERTMVINAPNIPDWNGKPLVEELQRTFRVPVYLENDTAIVGLGEALHGAGKGYGIVVYMTISTGVGGARIVSGRIDENALGFEPGHQIINFQDTHTKCGCGGYAHLEAYVSGSAIERKHGKKPYDIEDPAVWEEAAKLLAVGLNNTIVRWSPDIVVLGGPMITKKPGIAIERVREHVKNAVTIFPELPVIEQATLQNGGGLYGALALIKNYQSYHQT